MWSAMFLSVLLLPVGGFGSRKQLLAVPGGLCHRRIRRGSDDWNIHLFTRESSVACIYQSGARQWMIVVADEQEHAKCAGTRKEVEFALRAWLSPLDPPTIDQLKELA